MLIYALELLLRPAETLPLTVSLQTYKKMQMHQIPFLPRLRPTTLVGTLVHYVVLQILQLAEERIDCFLQLFSPSYIVCWLPVVAK